MPRGRLRSRPSRPLDSLWPSRGRTSLDLTPTANPSSPASRGSQITLRATNGLSRSFPSECPVGIWYQGHHSQQRYGPKTFADYRIDRIGTGVDAASDRSTGDGILSNAPALCALWRRPIDSSTWTRLVQWRFQKTSADDTYVCVRRHVCKKRHEKEHGFAAPFTRIGRAQTTPSLATSRPRSRSSPPRSANSESPLVAATAVAHSRGVEC